MLSKDEQLLQAQKSLAEKARQVELLREEQSRFNEKFMEQLRVKDESWKNRFKTQSFFFFFFSFFFCLTVSLARMPMSTWSQRLLLVFPSFVKFPQHVESYLLILRWLWSAMCVCLCTLGFNYRAGWMWQVGECKDFHNWHPWEGLTSTQKTHTRLFCLITKHVCFLIILQES